MTMDIDDALTPSMTASAEIPEATKVGPGDAVDRFVVLSRFSESETACAYLAHDPLLERTVVLKLLPPAQRALPGTADALLAQARILARANHPCVVTLFEVLSTAHGPVLVLEYLVGQSLEALVRGRGPLPGPDAIRLFDQILAGLEHLHHANVVHGGIEPGNVFVTSDQGVKLLDFRLARCLDGRARVSAGAETNANLLYAAPEQINGSGMDFRADLYAVGACLYEAVTGALPFERQHERAYEPAPEDLTLPAIALRAMRRDADQRTQTAHEFRSALRKLAAKAVDLPDLAVPRRAGERKKSGVVRFLGGLRVELALIALILLAAMSLWFIPAGDKGRPAGERAAPASAVQPLPRRPKPPPASATPLAPEAPPESVKPGESVKPPESDKYDALREAWSTE